MVPLQVMQVRLCNERDSIADLLREIGKQNFASKIVVDYSDKYKSQRMTLRYLTRFRNKLAERIQMEKEDQEKAYFESEKFRQEIKEDLHEDYLNIINCGRRTILPRLAETSEMYDYVSKKTFE